MPSSSVEVTESATGRSGFQITFTLGTNSIVQTLFLLAAGAPIPVLRVILVATFGGLPQVIMDGIVEHQEVVPDAMTGSSKLVVSGQDLSSIMDLIDLTGLLYPGMSPDLQVLSILGRYAAFGIIPEVMPIFIPEIPIPAEEIPVQGGTDLAYVKQLAHEAGYVFYVAPGPLPGTSQAYWGPQIRFRNSAACAQRQPGFLDQCRKPELPLSTPEPGHSHFFLFRTPPHTFPFRFWFRRSLRSIRRWAW